MSIHTIIVLPLFLNKIGPCCHSLHNHIPHQKLDMSLPETSSDNADNRPAYRSLYTDSKESLAQVLLWRPPKPKDCNKKARLKVALFPAEKQVHAHCANLMSVDMAALALSVTKSDAAVEGIPIMEGSTNLVAQAAQSALATSISL